MVLYGGEEEEKMTIIYLVGFGLICATTVTVIGGSLAEAFTAYLIGTLIGGKAYNERRY